MKISSINGYSINKNCGLKNKKMNNLNPAPTQDEVSFGKKNNVLLFTLAGIFAISPFLLFFLKQKKLAEANE